MSDKIKEKPFRFSMCNIKAGDKVTFYKNSKISALVVDDRHVNYKGKIYTLTGLARKLLDSKKDVQGPRIFLYNGELLTNLRKKINQS